MHKRCAERNVNIIKSLITSEYFMHLPTFIKAIQLSSNLFAKPKLSSQINKLQNIKIKTG